MSPALERLAARPYRSEAQARREREAKETLAAPRGIAETCGLALACWGLVWTLFEFVVPR